VYGNVRNWVSPTWYLSSSSLNFGFSTLRLLYLFASLYLHAFIGYLKWVFQSLISQHRSLSLFHQGTVVAFLGIISSAQLYMCWWGVCCFSQLVISCLIESMFVRKQQYPATLAHKLAVSFLDFFDPFGDKTYLVASSETSFSPQNCSPSGLPVHVVSDSVLESSFEVKSYYQYSFISLIAASLLVLTFSINTICQHNISWVQFRKLKVVRKEDLSTWVKAIKRVDIPAPSDRFGIHWRKPGQNLLFIHLQILVTFINLQVFGFFSCQKY